jgi:hypothetical protein
MMSLSSKTRVCDMICRVVFAAMDALSILNVAEALVSVTCVTKLTAPVDPLCTCICLTKQRPLAGAVSTLVVPVVVNENP